MHLAIRVTIQYSVPLLMSDRNARVILVKVAALQVSVVTALGRDLARNPPRGPDAAWEVETWLM